MESENVPTESVKAPAYLRQPMKGIIGLVVAAIYAVLVYGWTRLWNMSSTDSLSFNVLAYPWVWQWMWTFGGWPGNKISKNWIVVGLINQVPMWVSTWLSAQFFFWAFPGRSITDLGLVYAPMAVLAFAIYWFYFGNALNSYAGIAGKQPLDGIVNTFFAMFAVPPMLMYLGVNIVFAWFPFAALHALHWEWWPIDKMKIGGRGVAGTTMLFAFASLFLLILDKLGISFFTTTEGLWVAIILTFIALRTPWSFNNWPFRTLKQPLKGLALTVYAIVWLIILFYLTRFALPWIPSFGGPPELDAFIWWVIITDTGIMFEAPGTFNWWFKGYEAAPT